MKLDLNRLMLFAPDDAAGAGAGTPPPPPAGAGEKPKDPPAAPAEGDKKDPAKAGEDGKGKPKGILSPTQSDDAGKGQQAEAKEAGADDVIEVKLPDGVKIDKAALEKAMPLFKELKLNSESASKLVALQVELQKMDAERQQAAWEAQDDTWAKELKEDKEFGGKNFDASAAAAQKAVMKYGGRELAEFLDAHGLSNHPLLAKTFAKIGKADAEDTSRVDTTTKPKAPSPNQKLAARYSSLAKDLGEKQE